MPATAVIDSITVNLLNEGVAVQSSPKTVTGTGSARLLFNGQVAGSTTDQLWNVVATRSKINTIYIYSDVAVTLETNSSSVATDSLSIPAGVPVIWSADWPVTNPITANITAGIYITVPGSTLANLTISINLDA